MRHITTIACSLSVAMATPALAQFPCAPSREAITKPLQEHHGEAKVADGITEGGALAELWLSPAGSWTLVIILPNGHACMLASGQNWQEEEPET